MASAKVKRRIARVLLMIFVVAILSGGPGWNNGQAVFINIETHPAIGMCCFGGNV